MTDYYAILRVPRTATRKDIRDAFRVLARECHPDLHPGDAEAERQFKLLNEAHGCLVDDVRRREYDLLGAPAATATVIRIKANTYTAVELLARGDLSHVYRAIDQSGNTVAMKVSRTHRVNDLLAAGCERLATVAAAPISAAYAWLLPQVIEHSCVADTKKVMRHVTIMAWRPSMVSLHAVAEMYPRGLDGRHIVWLANRLLPAVAAAHERGIVNGAVLPEHLLINAATHDALMLGWPHACATGTPVGTIAAARRDFYPPEVLKKHPASSATDIFMIAQTLLHVGGNALEAPLRQWLNACRIGNVRRRPSDAWALFDELQLLAEKLYGPRKFVELLLVK